ncbi:hypothetical protein HOF92_15080, partial [bacterium]|nr:hypothetical protein [bacterium]
EVHSKFWDRHRLLRKDIETDLKTRLGKIAEKKVFYFSKWITKHLFSFVDQIQSSLGFLGSKDQDQLPGDQLSYQDQIFRNLEVSIVQSHGILLQASRKYDWISEPEELEIESIKARFREEFENFQQTIYEQISKSFESNVTTRHSLLAVSQEVLLSLLFYSFLGPIGFIPGSEQVLSGLCYLVYGKLPSAKLPSVMVELENLSKDCHKQFEGFLGGYLEEPCLKFESHRTQSQDLKTQWVQLRNELSSL